MTTKKIFSSMLATLMAIALILTGFTSAVQADDMIGAEDTVISTPTESECSFADNRVLVALTREASLAFSSYSVEDFSDIGCIKVTDLSDSAATMTKDALHQASILLTTGESTAFFEVQNKNKNVVSNYKQILCLELENPGRENVLAAVSLLQQRDDVYCAEPDYILVFEDIDENEGNLSSASVDYIGKPTSWAYDIIQTDDAYGLLWNITPATVGIIDTGIDGDHPLLQDAINVELCRDFSTGVEVATGVPTDSYGHGTMIAGIIAAQGGGVYSICPTAQLVSLRIASNYDNSPVVSYAIAAIDYANSVGIDVLSASFGFEDGTLIGQQSQLLSQAIYNYNGVFVCSAGNTASNNDKYPRWPSCYTHSNIISVGASDKDDQCWFEYSGAGSNYGKTSVDVFAPGVDMHTTVKGGGCTGDDVPRVTGTSYAVPIVVSVVALVIAQYPNLSADEVRQAIIDSVTPIESMAEKCVSGGRINAYRALCILQD